MTTLFRSALWVSGFALLSRILGFTRDILTAGLLGSSLAADALVVALTIPNLARRLLGEGAFAQALIPLLATHAQHPEHQAQLMSGVMTTLGVIVSALTMLAVVMAPGLVWVLAPGFGYGSAPFELAVQLLRWMLPYLIFLVLTALISAFLNYHQRFAWVAFTPCLLNLAVIIAALVLAPNMDPPVLALAWGVVLGGVVQLGLQWPLWWRLQGSIRWCWAWHDPQIKTLLLRLLPIVLSAAVPQLSFLLNSMLASTLSQGSIAWLYYADRLMQFPLGFLGAGLATVILPRLVQEEGSSPYHFSQTLQWALRWALLLALPATIGLMLLAQPIVTTLFYYGAFAAHDVQQTGMSLQAYTLGLLAFILIKILLPAFYARQQIRTPTRIAVLSLGLNLGLSLLLMGPLAQVGLALATALAAWLNAGLLFFSLHQRQLCVWQVGWGLFVGRLLLANLLMAFVILSLAEPVADWLLWSSRERLFELSGIMAAAVVSYGMGLAVLGLRPHHLQVASEKWIGG